MKFNNGNFSKTQNLKFYLNKFTNLIFEIEFFELIEMNHWSIPTSDLAS